MDLFLIMLLMALGIGMGAWVGSAIRGTPDEVVLLTSAVGGILGVVFAYLRLALFKSNSRDSRRNGRRVTPQLPVKLPPPAIRKRLAEYTGQDENDLLKDDDYKSRMPFWTAFETVFKNPPKPAALIRRSLLKIRQTLRS